MSAHPWKYAIVVGASSGMGYEIARQLAESGCKVAAVARRADRLDELANKFPGVVFPVVHDVTDFDSVPKIFQHCTDALGGLDLVAYASGVMPKVGFLEFDFKKDRQMVDVNLLGAIAWIDQAAERMQNTRHGSIVAISSVAGERGRSEQPVYNTTKAALNTYMEAVRNRIARYGVKVVTVKPGPTATEMTEHLHLKGMMSASDAASKIIRLSTKTGEHFLKPVHAVIFFIIRNFPSWLFRKLKV